MIPNSERILNPDGSIYHLHLLPEQVGDIIFLVGDPDRVPQVSKYFDRIFYRIQHREFVTHTGELAGKRVSCVATGIGTDNIDIVLNELDTLVNPSNDGPHKKLTFIRLGTSGSVCDELGVSQLVYSDYGIGADALMNFYQKNASSDEQSLLEACKTQLSDLNVIVPLYVSKAASMNKLASVADIRGITLTATGFYAPQGRQLRAQSTIPHLLDSVADFNWNGRKITNFEMETAGILGLAQALGHDAASFSVILAQRRLGIFSENPSKVVEQMIEKVIAKAVTI